MFRPVSATAPLFLVFLVAHLYLYLDLFFISVPNCGYYLGTLFICIPGICGGRALAHHHM